MATRINYKSDFDFIMKLADSSGADAGFPSFDWKAVLRTCGNCGFSARSFIVSYIGGVCTNCFNDNGQIHVVADNHGLTAGTLHVEFFAYPPNAIYPDGIQLTVSPQSVDIELVSGIGDGATDVEVSVQIPYIWQSAYDMAVANGYEGTMAEYVAAAAQLPSAVETANAVRDSVDCLQEATLSVSESAKTLEMLASEYADGRKAIADALTARDYPTEPAESFHAMAQKITDMSYGAGWLAEIGYTEDNNSVREAVQYARDLAQAWNPDGSTAQLFRNNNSLLFAPMVDTSNCQSLTYMFNGCASLVSMPHYDTKNVRDVSFMFSGCSALTTIPPIDLSSATIATYMFSEATALAEVPEFNTSNIISFTGFFHKCKTLRKVPLLDVASIASYVEMFRNCNSLKYLLLKNVGKSAQATITLAYLSVWGTGSDENRQSLIDSLITYSYDRAAAGMATATISLSTNTKALLTDEEIAQITAKGFTIS